jgi:AraC family transcriptional regulator of arabinose operon
VNRRQKGEGFPGQRIVVLPREVLSRAGKHPLLRGLLPTDAGYFPKAVRHLRERPAGVESAIFIYCVRGRGWCELKGNIHPVEAGELLVIPPGLPHAYGADGKQPWTIHWTHVTGENLASALNELGATAEHPILPLGENPQLLALFEEVLETLEHGYTPVRLIYAAQTFGHLVAAMIRLRYENFRGEPDAPQKIARSVAYMKQHLDKTLNVAALAALANLSSSHYTALFRQQTG